MQKGSPHDGSGAEVAAGLREAMRLFPQGVTVVTAQTKEGPKGITVSSFTSVSLAPPLVLISLAKDSDLHDLLVASSNFAVNFLADDQKSVSDLFAGRVPVKDRFDAVSYHKGASGSPIIDGVRCAIECRTWRVYEGGDHSIVLGEVVKTSVAGGRRPLVYYGQQYTSIERSEQPAPPSDIIW